jgi:hypothetical protein
MTADDPKKVFLKTIVTYCILTLNSRAHRRKKNVIFVKRWPVQAIYQTKLG